MRKKIVLITGCSRGLGKFLSNHLSEEYIVYASSRTSIPDHASKKTKFIHLDLSKEESMGKCIQKLIEKEGRIDVLIHNAGVAISGAPDEISPKEARDIFDVNFFGPVRLTQLVLPYMRMHKEGSIIFISSIRGVESYPLFGMYSASKAALEAVALDWAVILKEWNIKVSVIQPGPLNTGMQISQGSYYKNNRNPYPKVDDYIPSRESPENTLQIILEILNTENPKFAYQTSPLAQNQIAQHLMDPSRKTAIEQLYKEYNSSLISQANKTSVKNQYVEGT